MPVNCFQKGMKESSSGKSLNSPPDCPFSDLLWVQRHADDQKPAAYCHTLEVRFAFDRFGLTRFRPGEYDPAGALGFNQSHLLPDHEPAGAVLVIPEIPVFDFGKRPVHKFQP